MMFRGNKTLILIWICFVLFLSGTQAKAASIGDGWFGKDKAKHLVASALLAGGFSYRLRHDSNLNSGTCGRVGVGVAFSLGLAKEWSD
ncbi:MAG TPA: hypothetical protein VGB38_03395, partial [bacterium]